MSSGGGLDPGTRLMGWLGIFGWRWWRRRHALPPGDDLDGCDFSALVRAGATRWTTNADLERLLVPLLAAVHERREEAGDGR